MADVVACPSCGKRNRVPVSASGRPQCASCSAPLPWLVDAGDADFAAAVAGGGLTLVDLWAPWCGPCRMVAPVVADLANDYAGRLKVVKVNVDESPDVARRYHASSIPMLLFMRVGDVVETVVGAQPAHVMRSHVDRLLASAGATG